MENIERPVQSPCRIFDVGVVFSRISSCCQTFLDDYFQVKNFVQYRHQILTNKFVLRCGVCRVTGEVECGWIPL